MLVIGRGVNDEGGPTTGRVGCGKAIKGVRPLNIYVCAVTAQCGVGRVIGHQLHMVPYHACLWSLPGGEDSLRKFSR